MLPHQLLPATICIRLSTRPVHPCPCTLSYCSFRTGNICVMEASANRATFNRPSSETVATVNHQRDSKRGETRGKQQQASTTTNKKAQDLVRPYTTIKVHVQQLSNETTKYTFKRKTFISDTWNVDNDNCSKVSAKGRCCAKRVEGRDREREW